MQRFPRNHCQGYADRGHSGEGDTLQPYDLGEVGRLRFNAGEFRPGENVDTIGLERAERGYAGGTSQKAPDRVGAAWNTQPFAGP